MMQKAIWQNEGFHLLDRYISDNVVDRFGKVIDIASW